jgi:hypothetical protein
MMDKVQKSSNEECIGAFNCPFLRDAPFLKVLLCLSVIFLVSGYHLCVSCRLSAVQLLCGERISRTIHETC